MTIADKFGRVEVWTPVGEPLFLWVNGDGCSSKEPSVKDAKDNEIITLSCLRGISQKRFEKLNSFNCD